MSDTFFTTRNKALALAGVVVLFALIAAKGLGGSSADELAENPELAIVEDESPKPATAPAPSVAGWADAGESDDWGQTAPEADWSDRSSTGNSSEIDVGNAAPDRDGGTFASNARRSGNSGSEPRITSGAARNAPKISAPDSNSGGGGSLSIE